MRGLSTLRSYPSDGRIPLKRVDGTHNGSVVCRGFDRLSADKTEREETYGNSNEARRGLFSCQQATGLSH